MAPLPSVAFFTSTKLPTRNAGSENHVRLNHAVGLQQGIVLQDDAVRMLQGCALLHRPAAQALLHDGLGTGEFELGVDALHFFRVRRFDNGGIEPFGRRQGNQVRQVVFALGVVVADLLQQREQRFGPPQQQSRPTEVERPLLRAGVLLLDNAGKRPGAVQNQTAISGGIVRPETQPDEIGGTGFPPCGQHGLKGLAGDERPIAIEHQDLSTRRYLLFQQRGRRLHGMRGAKLLGLHSGRPGSDGLGDFGHVGPDHNDGLGRVQRLGGIQDMLHHGLSGNAVKDLRQGGAHPRSLARSQDNDAERCMIFFIRHHSIELAFLFVSVA